ncbi:hypothetical protein AUJ42_01465 [Candidatus Collierbacteria bacterium CG1_02_44_10]|uniref:Uncharacterized protein n=4 Tax=Candidatus Collieribacteriota TaxID=1752725 RepID=A0A2H0DUD3_9BACT|nr:hypothetical protein [bacterium]OIN91672.1 MAG: hypothetical protein AUJ42_01465 [Candidatus Collierbacteria bacterium CG1_02_44_10]PIP85763.1 MAG: hypothetical protein COW83_02495 [Candidatus Collierbacteria bacterium CG22_combo_CG10-13_8_21_14_all_43_12]PIR99784.1 MAG: hypothetical protein COT86_02150 [Candidatus Collierbacteria bacterium CG10_big_fil_rev_8_21_14_0_10_43_36]PIZ24404.1 MAG: hypothetical protein COY48_03110 [Candidatus Collierbacteria bacterium CG_4_10_14_0_8_um_filter_43_86
MGIIQSRLAVGRSVSLWYPQTGFKTIVVGRLPGHTGYVPEPGEAVHWNLPYLRRMFSRRIFALYCTAEGNLTIVRLSDTNSVMISSASNKPITFLDVHQRYTVSPDEMYNLTVTIHGLLIIKSQSVGQPHSGVLKTCILSMTREK